MPVNKSNDFKIKCYQTIALHIRSEVHTTDPNNSNVLHCGLYTCNEALKVYIHLSCLNRNHSTWFSDSCTALATEEDEIP